MKYTLHENALGDWAVIAIEKVYKNKFSGYILQTNRDDCNWYKGQYSDAWQGKPNYISMKKAHEIIVLGYIRQNKLAVDFDSTLASVTEFWPLAGKQNILNKLVAMYVRHMKKKGWIIILNTLREKGKGLEEAVQFCKDKNIPIDLVNENIQSDIEKWGDSRKIACTRSIDDTQVGLIGWLLRTFS